MDTHPKHLPADERRAVTVESVVALAGSQNPSEITTAAIAKHMNLTQGALFRHFPNKEALYLAVIRTASADFRADMTRRAGTGEDGDDRLRQIAADLSGNEELARAQATQDAAAATRIVTAALYGA